MSGHFHGLHALAGTLLLTLGASQVHAIVDTGPGPDNLGGWGLYNDGESYQSLAATFDVTESTIIRLAKGWIWGIDGGDIVLSLYAGGSPSAPLAYSTVFDVPQNASPGWYGAAGLAWAVAPGTYTLSFDAQPGTNAAMPAPSVNPLATEWYRASWTNGAWQQSDYLDIGLRVSAVPEPGTYGMLALGLLTVGAAARARRYSFAVTSL